MTGVEGAITGCIEVLTGTESRVDCGVSVGGVQTLSPTDVHVVVVLEKERGEEVSVYFILRY